MADLLPVWLLVIMLVLIVSAAVQAGVYVAHHTSLWRKDDKSAAEGVGSVVGALLGLLAFMLAFTFSMASERRESRKALLLEEVNSIGTTYLRAGLIPEPQRSNARELLRHYVDMRLEVAEDQRRWLDVVRESSVIHTQLWKDAEKLADADLKNPDITSLYITSLNETIDLQTSRLTVSAYRIPNVVWVTFIGMVVVASLAVGFNFGLQASGRHRLMTAMLAVSFAMVTFLILELDHGNYGWLKVDQQPMYDLREQLKE